MKFSERVQKQRAKNNSVVKDKSGFYRRIRDWHAETFPNDDIIEYFKRDDSTFYDVLDALFERNDVYDAIGVGDSIVRERVFEELSNMLGCSYDVIYNAWLNDYDALYELDDLVNKQVNKKYDNVKKGFIMDLDKYDDIGYMAEACANEMDSVFDAINTTPTADLEFKCSPDEYYQKLLECKKTIDWLVDNISVWVR